MDEYELMDHIWGMVRLLGPDILVSGQNQNCQNCQNCICALEMSACSSNAITYYDQLCNSSIPRCFPFFRRFEEHTHLVYRHGKALLGLCGTVGTHPDPDPWVIAVTIGGTPVGEPLVIYPGECKMPVWDMGPVMLAHLEFHDTRIIIHERPKDMTCELLRVFCNTLTRRTKEITIGPMSNGTTDEFFMTSCGLGGVFNDLNSMIRFRLQRDGPIQFGKSIPSCISTESYEMSRLAGLLPVDFDIGNNLHKMVCADCRAAHAKATALVYDWYGPLRSADRISTFRDELLAVAHLRADN